MNIKRLFTFENLYIAAFLLILSGIISFIVGETSVPLTAAFTSNLSYQTLFETIILFFINVLGISGLFLLFRTGKANDVRVARTYLFTGLIFIVVWYLLIYELYYTVA
ncbi:MAG: hypothetical protein ACP5FU_04990 [Nitrososphaeria archaeon]